jgi:hypothetical protein
MTEACKLGTNHLVITAASYHVCVCACACACVVRVCVCVCEATKNYSFNMCLYKSTFEKDKILYHIKYRLNVGQSIGQYE